MSKSIAEIFYAALLIHELKLGTRAASVNVYFFN